MSKKIDGIKWTIGLISYFLPFTNGGAMTDKVAMFGEGSKPEAYVPLPDGRSIPVNIAGGGRDSRFDGFDLKKIKNS